MPFEIHNRGTHFYLRLHGVVTASDLEQLAVEAARVEATVPDSLDRLVDLREVQQMAVGYPEIQKLAERRRKAHFTRRVKSAIVIGSPVQRGFARMFQTLNDHRQIEIQIFDTMDEAVAWSSGGRTPRSPTGQRPVSIALVGDYRAEVRAHQAIPEALGRVQADLGVEVRFAWHHTSSLGPHPEQRLSDADAVWCVPASPYADNEAVIGSIRHVRETGTPFLGTCGGFQFALLEYARDVWKLNHAVHAEIEPDATLALISPLTCSLVEKSGSVSFSRDSRLARAYGALEAMEEYHCNYGLNPAHEALLERGDLRVVARDPDGEVRAVELSGHPFFVATLFQPERAALLGKTPPLVRAFVEAALVASKARAQNA